MIGAEVLINSERAWIMVTDILLQDGRHGFTLGFIFNLTNGGKTSARIRSLMVRCHCSSGDLPGTPDYSLAKRHTFVDEPGYETLLIPGEKLSSPLRIEIEDGLDGNIFEGVSSGELQLYAYGLLTYIDAFERKRILQFGYVYGPERDAPLGWKLPAQWAAIQLKEYNRHS